METLVLSQEYNQIRSDGVLMGEDTARKDITAGLALNGIFGRHNEQSTAELAELLIYRRRLNQEEIVNVEMYLAEKYNLNIPSTHRMLPFDDETRTKDFYASAAIEREFPLLAPTRLVWGSRTIPTDISGQSVLQLAVRIVEEPFEWSIPLMLVLLPADSPLLPSDRCITLGELCRTNMVYRICFNTGAYQACDEVSVLPPNEWVTETRVIADRFKSKYPTRQVPSRLKVVLASFALRQQLEVLVDELRIVNFSPLQTSCPVYSAASSAIANSMDFPGANSWEINDDNGVTVTTSGTGLRFSGTPTAAASARAITQSYYYDNRNEQFRLTLTNLGVGTVAPRFSFCSKRAALTRSAQTNSWVFVSGTASAVEPPSSFVQVINEGSTMWENDRHRPHPVDTLPYSPSSSYSFWIKLTKLADSWNGIFFRGGNVGYTQEGTNTQICCGSDRVPALWQYPNRGMLHIRQSTTTSWNNGCDGSQELRLNEWYHVSIVIETNVMQVFYNGEVVCSTTYGRNQQIIETPGRIFGSPHSPYQWAGGGIFLDDLRYYQEALNVLQIQRLAESRSGIERTSSLTTQGSVLLSCIMNGPNTWVYEDGVLRAAFSDSAGGSVSNTPVTFALEQSSGQGVDVSVSSITVFERREGLLDPVFCPASGTYLQIVAAAVTYTEAEADAESRTYQGNNGYLASILTNEESACLSAFNMDCKKLWIGGSRQSGTWRWVGGPEKGSAIGATQQRWAAGYTTTEPYLYVNPGGCRSAASPAGAWGSCSDTCPGIEGYVVEYDAPPQQVEEYASLSLGATIASVSSQLGPGSYVQDPSVMRDNLLRDVNIPVLGNGDARYIFEVNDAVQQIVVDLSATRMLNRLGVVVEQTEALRSVTDAVAFETSTSASGNDFQPWGAVGVLNDGVAQVFSPSVFVSLPLPRAVRRVRYTIGARPGSIGMSAMTRVHAQLVRTTYTRLEQNGVDYSLDQPGLNMAAFDGTTGTLKDRKTFTLDSLASVQEVRDFIDGLNDGDVVLGATRDQPKAVKQLFRESFDSFEHPNTPDRLQSFTPGKGIYQALPNATYAEAQSYCRSIGRTMCPRIAVCYPPRSIDNLPNGHPIFGWSLDGDAYVPIADTYGEYLGIGQAFDRSASLCKTYSEVNGAVPPDSLTRTWFRTHVMCCHATPAVQWKEVTNTGDLRRIPWWLISLSRLQMYGFAFSSESYAELSNPTNPYGTYLYLDNEDAYTWTDYEAEFDGLIHHRAFGVLMRYSDSQNYYRIIVTRWGANRVIFQRIRNGVGEEVDPSAITDFKQIGTMGTWRKFQFTLVGGTLTVKVEGVQVFQATDPNPLTRGTFAFYAWGNSNMYFDNLVIRTVSTWSVYKSIAEDSLRNLGIQSLAGVDTGSWTVLGTKGAPPGSVPHSASASGQPLSISNMFDCKLHRRTIAENAKPGTLVPRPLTMLPGKVPGGFEVRSGNQTVLGVNPSTGQLMVLRSEEELDFETAPPGGFGLLVSAQEAGFDTGWFKMGSQAGPLSFKELHHGLNIPPELLKMQVWIRPVDGPNKGFRFRGHGSAQMVDFSWVLRYGGVVGAYDSTRVRLWAPTSWQIASSGYIVNIGEGWGGEFKDSSTVFVKEHNSQRSHLADIRVIIRRDVPPDFDSGPFVMKAEEGSASTVDIRHNLGGIPARVRAFAVGDSGDSAGFVFDGSGAAFRDYRIGHRPMGGLIYAYNEDIVRCFVPARYQHTRNLGAVNFVGEGWGGEQKPVNDKQAVVRVMAWSVDTPPDYESGWFRMAALKSDRAFFELRHGLGGPPERILVESETPQTSGGRMLFEGVGMPQTTQWWYYYGYGGIVFAANDTVIRLWAASSNPNSPDFNVDSQWLFTIHASYGWGGEINHYRLSDANVRVKMWRSDVGLGDSAEVEVEVRDVHEPPSIVGHNVVLDENAPQDSIIGDLEVNDGDDCPDGGAGPRPCNLNFEIISGNENGAVGINAKGELYVANASAFNYEERRVIALGVKVDDGLLSAYALPRFKLRDINDRPVIQQDAWLTILEESPVNTKVGYPINSTDEDVRQVGLYSIVGGNDAGVFKIGGCDGQVRVRNPALIDYEQVKNYTITVMVVDDGVPPLNATAEVFIEILNRNDPPEIKPQTLSVGENLRLWEAVGTPVVAFDQDGDDLLFSIEAGNEFENFAIDNTTGQLYIVKEGFLNFENPLYAQHVMDVVVFDGEFSAIGTITVVVEDRNDPPVPRGPIGGLFLVAENSPMDTSVGVLQATDEDAGDTLSFAIGGITPAAYTDVFEINSVTGEVVISANGDGILDFEAGDNIKITINVTDNGGSPLVNSDPITVQATYPINIVDVNEPPILTLEQEFWVFENATEGFVFGTIEVYDDDVRDMPEDQRGFKFGSVGGTNTIFHIDEATGDLSIGSTPADFETQPMHVILIRVEDSGDPPLSDNTTITVHVLDSNDPPRPACNRGIAWERLLGIDAISAVLTGSNLPTTTDVSQAVFRLGLITAATDREAEVQCHALCDAVPSCDAYTFFGRQYPRVTYRNMCIGRRTSPAWNAAGSTAKDSVWSGRRRPYCQLMTIDENSNNGVVLQSFTMSDDENNGITVRMKSSTLLGSLTMTQLSNSAFEFAVNNGSLLDYEEQSSVFMELEFFDDTDSGAVTYEWFAVNIADINEAPYLNPEEGSSPIRIAAEGEAANFPLPPPARFIDPEGDTITFSMAGSTEGNFALDSATGMFSTAKELPQLGVSKDYTVQVTASDPSGKSTTVNFVLRIEDQNKRPTLQNVNVGRKIPENSAIGTLVAATTSGAQPTFTSTDPDGNAVVFSVTPLVPNIPFLKITTTQNGGTFTGTLSMARDDLDFEEYPSLLVRVSATDDNSERPLTITADVTITVEDVAEPPQVIEPCTASLNENADATVNSITCTVYDPDADSTTLQYSVTDPQYSSSFTAADRALIVGDVPPGYSQSRCHTFAVTFLNGFRFNYEAKAQWTIPVAVSDGTFTVNVDVAVTVRDVREAPIVLASQFTAPESDIVATATYIGSVNATDEDLNSALTYSLRTRTETFIFLSPTSPMLYVQAGARFDFEKEEVISVEVTVRDQNDIYIGGPDLSARQTLTVFLTDVNDVALSSVLPVDSATSLSNIPTSTPIGFYIIGRNFGPTVTKEPSEANRPIPQVTYGGPDGLRFQATSCKVDMPTDPSDTLGNTRISCMTAEGIGKNLPLSVTVGGWTASANASASINITYALPVVTGIISGDAFSTRGGDRFTLTGSNFGPAGLTDPIQVRYRLPGSDVVYAATACSVTTAHTRVTCTSSAGVGANHRWSIEIGGQWSQEVVLPSAYLPPRLDTLTVVGTGNLTTNGLSKVTIRGDNFGPAMQSGTSTLQATYGPSGVEYSVECQLITEHTRILCDTRPGIGANLVWQVSVGGQVSNPSLESTSYTWPRLLATGAVSGPNARGAATRGGQFVSVHGENLGPVTSTLPTSLNVTYWAYYGPFNDVSRYLATECAVNIADSRMQCVLAPGSGSNHSWFLALEVCDAQRLRCSWQHTTVVFANTSYGPPVVGTILGDGANSPTQGAVSVTLLGFNFGPSIDVVQRVEFTMMDSTADLDPLVTNSASRPRVYEVTDCVMVIPHEQLECTMPPGAGRNLTWSMTVDGLKSIQPTYSYLAPSLLALGRLDSDGVTVLSPATDFSTTGGDVLDVVGDNFGPATPNYIESISFGPTGAEYDITDKCTFFTPHNNTRCIIPPGVGANLELSLKVAGQGSMVDSRVTNLESIRLSYKKPRITSMALAPSHIGGTNPMANFVTAGGTRFRLKGANFGPPTMAHLIAVRVGNTQSGCMGPQGVRSCPIILRQTDTEIDFETPAGVGVNLPVAVVSGNQASTEEILFSYSPPRIDYLSVEYSNDTLLILKGINFGTSGWLRVRDLQTSEILGEHVLPMPGYLHDHKEVHVAVPYQRGAVTLIIGEQESNVKVYTQASPVIHSSKLMPMPFVWPPMPACDSVGDQTAPLNASNIRHRAGATAGQFLLVLDVENAGRTPEPPHWYPELNITVNDQPCLVRPVDRCRNSNNQEVLLPTFNVKGDFLARAEVACVVPEGEGSVLAVVRQNFTQPSGEDSITYNAPSSVVFSDVRGVRQPGVITGQKVGIEGLDLGLGASIQLIADLVESGTTRIITCSLNPGPGECLARYNTTHSSIVFTAPPSMGTNVTVRVIVGEQTHSTPLMLDYALPEANSKNISIEVGVGDRRTVGGFEFSIRGSNFGERYWTDPDTMEVHEIAYVTVNGMKVPNCPVWTDTLITCIMPENQGKDPDVRVVINGIPSTRLGDEGLFRFAPPTVHNAPHHFHFDTTGYDPQDNDTKVVLHGDNFGLHGKIHFGNTAWDSRTDTHIVAFYNHTMIELLIPEGTGRNIPLVIHVDDQYTNETLMVSYNPPTMDIMDPASGPTDACHEWDRLTDFNRGLVSDGSGNLKRACCRPVFVKLTGANFGPTGNKKLRVLVGNKQVTQYCKDLTATRNSMLYGMRPLWEGKQCNPRCKKNSMTDDVIEDNWRADNCFDSAPGGPCCLFDQSEIRDDRFDSSVYLNHPNPERANFTCQCPVADGPCLMSHTHDAIYLRPPSGFGDVEVRVEVDSQVSNVKVFGYDSPRVVRVDTTPYDANGQRLVLEGKNFGDFTENTDAIQQLRIELQNLTCANPAWGQDATGELYDGMPYLSCEAPRDASGPKFATVAVGTQETYFPPRTDLFWSQCMPGHYGFDNELCLPCPVGAFCAGYNASSRSVPPPYTLPGWWMMVADNKDARCPVERKAVNTTCFLVFPCDPPDICLGKNECRPGHDPTSLRCSMCVQGYYLLDGLCEPCPDNPIMTVVLCLVGLVGLCVGAYLLNKKVVNMGLFAILVDYLQVLSIFSRSRVAWPSIVKDFFQFFAVFNLNIDIMKPECAFPSMDYGDKWMIIMLIPLAISSGFLVLHCVVYMYKWICLRRDKKKRNRHLPVLLSSIISVMYLFYLYLSRSTFDVFNCQVCAFVKVQLCLLSP